MLKKVFSILCLFTLASCGVEEEGTSANPAVSCQTEQGRPCLGKWPETAFPLGLRISQDFNTEELMSIESALDSWEVEGGGDMIAGGLFNASDSHDLPEFDRLKDYGGAPMGIYRKSNWFTSGTTEDALAVTYYKGAVDSTGFFNFNHAVIILNDSHPYTSLPEQGELTEDERSFFDLESIIVHELGHFLGLDHYSGNLNRVVMGPQLQPGFRRREVQEEDRETFLDIYDLDSDQTTTTVLASGQGSSSSSQTLEISGHSELRADGICHHYQSNTFVFAH